MSREQKQGWGKWPVGLVTFGGGLLGVDTAKRNLEVPDGIDISDVFNVSLFAGAAVLAVVGLAVLIKR